MVDRPQHVAGVFFDLHVLRCYDQVSHRRGADVQFQIRADGAGHAVRGGEFGDATRLGDAAVLAGVNADDIAACVADQFAGMHQVETHVVGHDLRLYLAAALRRIEHPGLIGRIAEALVRHNEDADDHNIPKMIWYGIEPHVPNYPDEALQLATQSKIPIITQFVARRLADADQLDALVEGIGRASDADIQTLLLRGMREGLQGAVDLKSPPSWADVYAKLDKSGEVGSTGNSSGNHLHFEIQSGRLWKGWTGSRNPQKWNDV